MAAALSVAPTSATTLTPPSSSHGNDDPWAYAVGNVEPTKKTMPNPALSPNPTPQNAGATVVSKNNPRSPPEMGSLRADGGGAGRPQIADYSPPWGQDEDEAGGGDGGDGAVPTGNGVPNGNDNGAPDKRAASDRQDGAAAAAGGKEPEENSKWIHRDKLARIENEELQAAGLVLPRPIPRPTRKDRSTDRLAGRSPERGITRPKTRGSDSTTASATTSAAAAAAAAAAATTSRIPVAKFAPTPISLDSGPDGHEGDSQLSGTAKTGTAAAARSRSISVSQGAGAGPGTPPRAQPTSTKRSVTADSSPKKKSAAGTNGSLNGRKPPPSSKTASTSRPRTRGIESRSGSISNNRPTTRSGDLSPPGNARKPEGEPPWMISAYKPDPRLPPDQQLLPTVARRLQQEKWEKEGKFGSVYDKEFRPLTDDGLLDPPEPSPRSSQPPPGGEDEDRAPSRQNEQQNEQQQPDGGDWPLRPDPDQSPPPTAAANRASSYSTMPKISDKPGIASPPPGPKSPQDEMQRQLSQRSNLQVTRMPEDPEPEPSSLESPPEKAKASCLCCIVM